MSITTQTTVLSGIKKQFFIFQWSTKFLVTRQYIPYYYIIKKILPAAVEGSEWDKDYVIALPEEVNGESVYLAGDMIIVAQNLML